MMLEELSQLMECLPADQREMPQIRLAIEEDNCLNKRSSKTRSLTLRHLHGLYGLDSAQLVFRGLCYFWDRDEPGRPLLALCASFARDALLARAIAGGDGPDEDLYEVEGMTQELATALADKGVRTRDDLADLGSDELAELIGIEEDAAGEIIMAARAHWFAE